MDKIKTQAVELAAGLNAATDLAHRRRDARTTAIAKIDAWTRQALEVLKREGQLSALVGAPFAGLLLGRPVAAPCSAFVVGNIVEADNGPRLERADPWALLVVESSPFGWLHATAVVWADDGQPEPRRHDLGRVDPLSAKEFPVVVARFFEQALGAWPAPPPGEDDLQ